MKLFSLILFFFFTLNLYSQNDSLTPRLSLITCDPSEELYSLFGHTAIRYRVGKKIDEVYNYGVFDFEEGGFYVKFIFGKLKYKVEKNNYADFLYEYEYFKRNVNEQILDLNADEIEAIHQKLETNILPQNAFYNYDFFYDNCTTRARDILKGIRLDSLQYNKILAENYSFRDAIHIYLQKQKSHWNEWGIDLLLGAKCDKVMSKTEEQFLPNVLMATYDKKELLNKNVLLGKDTINFSNGETQAKAFWITPLIGFLLLSIGSLLLRYFLWLKNKKFFRVDQWVYFIYGLLGCFLLFMWLGTNHQLCSNNYNLLWANPLHLIFAFWLHKNNLFTRIYHHIILITSIICLAGYYFFPQQLHFATVPLIVLPFLLQITRRSFFMKNL